MWLAQVRRMHGRHDDARTLFARVLGSRNDVGLLAEQYDIRARRQCGNFPQTLSHDAVINTAIMLG
ncbi:hypothetical protein CI15_25620 [Paraburkholderia monticola]|uniref:GH15-like domain-containing protein n=1 Tax=Paraburkholderia monticola TaxID=1399968 RepID=A0A149PFR7_9BURK|nr:hypothetical protein CI15_25620 [Paraburkholderia monticola]